MMIIDACECVFFITIGKMITIYFLDFERIMEKTVRSQWGILLVS